MLRFPSIILLGVLMLHGCDRINDPLVTPTGNNGNGNGGGPVMRKVLLEDFTGHTCVNCPSAARIAANLVDVYGEDLVVVGVHCTSTFAAPANPPNANGSYATDFRTPAGDAYENALNIFFLPNGAVNRKPFNNSITLGAAAWGSAVADAMGQEADFDIWFSQLQHDPATNTVNVEVKVAVLHDVTSDHNLTIYLTEDSVIDWQKDAEANPDDIQNYVHRHVLRTNLNSPWGAPVVVGQALAGDTITLNYPNFAVNPTWVAEHCALVAYVHNTATFEVMQVTEEHFEH